ncbi:unnamed protein product [Microthlaspi erraticum]|uniref:Uncharacterized protein n=1 Tax=Microthlaspi erraticum TaxID=1685480 RepID=A0A6D2KBH6_9BRAS|nr:unnamed protein product [Microthlaspi erraticum]
MMSINSKGEQRRRILLRSATTADTTIRQRRPATDLQSISPWFEGRKQREKSEREITNRRCDLIGRSIPQRQHGQRQHGQRQPTVAEGFKRRFHCEYNDSRGKQTQTRISLIYEYDLQKYTSEEEGEKAAATIVGLSFFFDGDGGRREHAIAYPTKRENGTDLGLRK